MLAGPMPARAHARALLLAGFLATSVASAAAGVESVPDEEAALLPGGDSLGAMVGDVDGDGQRELVRLMAWEVNPSQLAVEVVSMTRGLPQLHGQQVVERAATPDDTFLGGNPDEHALLPLSTGEPTRLIAWRGPGGERVLAASIGITGLPRPCCLTLWWVTLDRDGATRLEYVQNTMSSASHVVAVDMDEDGVDELAVAETPNPNRPNATAVLVLRWNGADFDLLRDTARNAQGGGQLAVLGDTDGLPGTEVGFVAMPSSFDQVVPSLHRFRLDGGRVRGERVRLPSDGTVVGIPGADGGRIGLVSPGEVYLLEWGSREREATIVANSFRGGTALGVLGRGGDARLLVLRGGAVDMLDADLASRHGLAGGLAASWFAASSWPPYSGELPGGDATGRSAMIFGGRLINAPDGSSLAPFRDIAALPGRTPVGLFGPRRGWAAVADGGALPVGRRGGSLVVAAGARAASIAVVRTAVLMQPELDGALLQPQIVGAVLDDGQPARPILLTSAGAAAHFDAPPGSVTQVSGHPGEPAATTVGSDGMAAPVLVPSREAANDESFTVRLLVATPSGHGYGAIWEVRVIRRPPSISATTPFAPFSFSVPLSGRTSSSASLLVDGEPVRLGADGSFLTNVSAGPFPRTVTLEATDRVGNSTELAVSVVGVLDYRRLPWIPIVAGLTLLSAGVLYLRVPKPSAARGGTDPDEGVLEEIQ